MSRGLWTRGPRGPKYTGHPRALGLPPEMPPDEATERCPERWQFHIARIFSEIRVNSILSCFEQCGAPSEASTGKIRSPYAARFGAPFGTSMGKIRSRYAVAAGKIRRGDSAT